ncbi:MAG: HD domain-containing protein [candidate division Zixibacteria bacterium]|nr:HD domain-containing protein [candidate division Zixibacteria bacterium]
MSIRDLVSGERVEAFFALRKVERRESQGSERLTMEFGDPSGRIDAVMWEGFETIADQLTVGTVVKVRGVVGIYRDRPQIRVERIRPAAGDEVRAEDFVPRSSVDPETLATELDRRIAQLHDPHLSQLMNNLLGSGAVREAYLRAPAGKLWHHNTIGGLAEHSLNLARICEFACQIYPELDLELLVCGALLHDVGKIEQYEVSAMIDYSDEGRLVGHINSGDFRVATAIRAIEGFPERTERALRHLIVSHQGELEKGTPIVPQTPEAFVLYCADELDSKMGALRHIAEKTGGRDWSDFVNLIGRHIYFGRRSSDPATE